MANGIGVLSDWLSKGIRFVSVTQGFDFAGTIGKMIAALLFGVAEMEQETRRERQAAGIGVAKQNGVYTGRKSGTTKAKPDRAKQLRHRGLSVAEIAKSLGVSTRSVHRYLKAN